jgi:RNA polymerase sigma factor (sigma-70 family)
MMRMPWFGATGRQASRRDAYRRSRQEPGMGVPDLADADDADLVRRLRDPAALEELYRRHVRPLTRYAVRRLDGDADAAGDLVAATFLAAIESADRFDARRGEVAGWLFGIANNLLAGQHRRSVAESRAVARYRGRREIATDEYGRLEERLDAHRRTGPAQVVLRALPPAERELLGLVLHAGLTVREAAAALGIRPGTARMRLARARTRLAAAEGEL